MMNLLKISFYLWAKIEISKTWLHFTIVKAENACEETGFSKFFRGRLILVQSEPSFSKKWVLYFRGLPVLFARHSCSGNSESLVELDTAALGRFAGRPSMGTLLLSIANMLAIWSVYWPWPETRSCPYSSLFLPARKGPVWQQIIAPKITSHLRARACYRAHSF